MHGWAPLPHWARRQFSSSAHGLKYLWAPIPMGLVGMGPWAGAVQFGSQGQF